jgi:acyl transferase domain-containing protein
MDDTGDIAIIGMACLLPGARNFDAYWSNILAKRNFIKDAPDHWCDGRYDPNSKELDRIYTKRVGLLGELATFDPLEFGIVPKAIPATEPDHLLALKLASRALRHAGYEARPFDRSRTGIILGRGATPNRGSANGLMSSLALEQIIGLLSRILPELDAETLEKVRASLRTSLHPLVPEAAPGLVSNVTVGRIANRLDLQGPSYMIDAACSSTLIAVDLAMKELRSGQSRMMLAGGVQASMPPQVCMLFCQLNALSRTSAMPFDKKADGTILAEGAGFLVLKRLSDAKSDGDTIYAVLKAAGIASDGRAKGLLTPRVEGEALAIRRAYEQSGIDPESVGLIEAHGTGIPLGDQTEIEALRSVFPASASRIPSHALGSVKSMIGHCIPAAGVASLVKAALALYYKIFPPTLCEEVDEALDLGNSPFYINTETRPWIHANREEPRRAAVSGFGFGGINAHVILEEYKEDPALEVSGFPWPTELIVLSAATPDTLAQCALDISQRLLTRRDVGLAGVALAMSTPESGACRLAIVAGNIEDLAAKLETAAQKIRDGKRTRLQTRSGIYFVLGEEKRLSGKTVFLFPGQGSQYPNMLFDLCLAFPQVRREFDHSDAAFIGVWDFLPSQYVFPPPTCIKPELSREMAEKYLSIDAAMETIFTANMAIFKLLSACRLRCDMMLGHSTGEYTALVASGAVDVPASSAEQIAVKRKLNRFYRDMKTAESVPRGSLLTVGAVEPETLAEQISHFAGRIYIAMDNCPHQKILFGMPDDISALSERLKALGGLCQLMPFNYAYHTPLLGPMKEELHNFYRQFPLAAPKQRLMSCASLSEFPADPDGVRELSVSQWSTTVRFREIIERLYDEEGVRFFIEVGPSAYLTAFVEDTLRKREFLAVASNERTRPALEQIQRLLGQLWCHGHAVDFSPLYQNRAIEPFEWETGVDTGKRPSKLNKPLDVSMPALHLDEETLREVRRNAGLEKGADTPGPASRVSDPAPVLQRTPTESLLVANEELMREFLASQERSIAALLDKLSPPR